MHSGLEKKLFLGAAGLGAILLVPTMAVSGMMTGLASGSPIQALGGLLAGAIAGGLFAIVIGGIAAVGWGTLYRSCAGTDDQVVRYMEEVTVHASRAEALSACERAIATLDGKLTPIEAAGSPHVAMLVKPGWRWYGEIVSCDVVEIAPGTQRVTVESRPQVSTAVLAWRRSVDNVRHVVGRLRARFPVDAGDAQQRLPADSARREVDSAACEEDAPRS